MPIQVLEYTQRTCDVCRLLENDTTPKPCGYCGLCDAWICKDDLGRWGRRIRAWYKRRLEGDYKGIPDYDQHAVDKKTLDEITKEGNLN